MVEIYKTRNGRERTFMHEIFEEKALPYQLGCSNNLIPPKVKTKSYNTDKVRFLGQRIWAKLPSSIET